MTDAYKVLAQNSPVAGDSVNIYTVPASTQAIIDSVVVTNRGTADTYRLSVNVSGAGVGYNASFIAYDSPIAANDSITLNLGITMGTGDIFRVRSANGNSSFSLYGVEIS